MECKYLAIVRKLCVIWVYSTLQSKIEESLEVLPEMKKYVNPPTTLKTAYDYEIEQHDILFNYSLKFRSEEELKNLLNRAKILEEKFQDIFDNEYSKIQQGDKEICGGLLNFKIDI